MHVGGVFNAGRNPIQVEIASRHLAVDIFNLYSERKRNYCYGSKSGHTQYSSGGTKAEGVVVTVPRGMCRESERS